MPKFSHGVEKPKNPNHTLQGNSMKRKASDNNSSKNMTPNSNSGGKLNHWTIEEFDDWLDRYNMIGVGVEGPLELIACANVSAKMCSGCGDGGKVMGSMNTYYMYANEMAQARTILCHECVATILQEFATDQELKEENKCEEETTF